MTLGIPPQLIDGLRYNGPVLAVVALVQGPRAPEVTDRNYPLFTLWRNSDKSATLPDAEGDLWYLAKFDGSSYPADAIWIKLSGGVPVPPILELAGDTGSASGSVINVFSDSFYHAQGGTGIITGAGDTLTLNLSQALASPSPIGSVAPNTGAFTSLSSNAGQNFSREVDLFPVTRITALSSTNGVNVVVRTNMTASIPANITPPFGQAWEQFTQLPDGSTALTGSLFSYWVNTTSGSETSAMTLRVLGSGISVDSLRIAPTGAILPAGKSVLYNDSAGNIGTAPANALSIYEEGTFTPTLIGETTAGTTTYIGQAGFYTRIGNTCFIQANISISAATGTGNALIGGLPFPIKNIAGGFPAGSVILDGAWTWPTGTTSIAIQGLPNQTNVGIQCSGTGVAAATMQMTNAAATFLLNLTYKI